MLFSGDFVQIDTNSLPNVGKVTVGNNQYTSFISEKDGVRFMVKKGARPYLQALIDEMKPYFGLLKMGVSYNYGYMFVKMADVKGDLWSTVEWMNSFQLIDEFTKIQMFRFIIKSKDMLLTNVMWTTQDRLLSIDEVAGLEDFDEPIKNKIVKEREQAWYLTRASYARTRDGLFKLLDELDRENLSKLFLKFGQPRTFLRFEEETRKRSKIDEYFEYKA